MARPASTTTDKDGRPAWRGIDLRRYRLENDVSQESIAAYIKTSRENVVQRERAGVVLKATAERFMKAIELANARQRGIRTERREELRRISVEAATEGALEQMAHPPTLVDRVASYIGRNALQPMTVGEIWNGLEPHDRPKSRQSVSIALHKLHEEGVIVLDENTHWKLSPPTRRLIEAMARSDVRNDEGGAS